MQTIAPVKPKAAIDGTLSRLRLRQIRELHLASRPLFASVLGVPPTTLKNWELGYREMPLMLAQRIAKHVGVDWAMFLLGLSEQPTVISHLARNPDSGEYYLAPVLGKGA